MGLKYWLLFVVMFISTANARPRRTSCRPYSIPALISTMATPCPTVIETIDYTCSCQMACNEQLILPPLAVELPRGLGYFPAALPLVAKYFEPAMDFLTTGAYLPVASSCDCLTLAAPINPEIAPLVKPIIL